MACNTSWDEQKGGWWKADGTEWQRKRIPEPGPPKGPTKWTIAFEGKSAQQGKRARRRCASTALRSIAPSTSTRSITRCAAPVPRGAGVASGAHDIPPADEPHANRNSRVPGASSTRTGLSRARSTSMAPSVVSTVSRGENRTASMQSTGAWPSSSAGPRTSLTRCT